MLRAFFQENQDIGRLEVLTAIAAELGLDADDYARALNEGTYRKAHEEALRTAEAYSISVVPTVIVNERYRIEGVPDAARLRKAILEEQAASPDAPGKACGIDGC